MSYTNKTIRLLAKSFLLSIGLTLVACGGGGGNSGGGIPSATVSYSGNTNQADIDETSAQDIANTYMAANQENLGGMITGVQVTTPQNTFTEAQKKSLIDKLKQHALATVNQDLAVTGIGAILTGDCAYYDANLSNGSVTSSILSQSPTKVVTKISYNNVCLYNFDLNNPSYLKLTGDVYSTVTGDLQAGIINTLDLYIPTLTGNFVDVSTGDTYVEIFSEQITFIFEDYDVNGFPTKITIIDKSDINSTGTVYRFEVETVTINNITITKLKFYHPAHGWIEYIDNLTYGTCGDLPDGGTLTIIGANATAVIEPTGDCSTYTVAVNYN